jgi:transposase
MFIRRTTVKSRQSGEVYYTYRLVENFRTADGVRQRTLLNLGSRFEVPKEQWSALARRIEALLHGQLDLMPEDLDPHWEATAQGYAARIIRARGKSAEEDSANKSALADYQRVDLSKLDLVQPRSVGVEAVALSTLRQLGLDSKLQALGLNNQQLAVAIGLIIARMTKPASELATHEWLQNHSGLGELLGHDFSTTALTRLYRVSDQLLGHKEALESYLFGRQRDLFSLEETITLYDLTNTFFEGSAKANGKAKRGHSKEKRSDCPLVTLALVLDGQGFPKRSATFEGNVSEPKTLAAMLERFSQSGGEPRATVVLDAGLATEANIVWLKEQGYRYLVVSRSPKKIFDEEEATLIKEDGKVCIRAQRVLDEETGEVRLYCHSSQREEKDRAIRRRFSERFEEELNHIAEGLTKKGRVKNYEKILLRIGRLKQRYSRVVRFYDIRVQKDEETGNAKAVHWSRITAEEKTHLGVYCLRTNEVNWDEQTLWNTYTMLTDLEAVFRSLKSELGLRPVYHHKTGRVDAHLFISVLAYHFVHTLRFQLKARGIHLSWEGIRRQLDGQDRITVVLHRDDGKVYHVRKSTRPEPRQQIILDALGLPHCPGFTQKTLIDSHAGQQEQM